MTTSVGTPRRVLVAGGTSTTGEAVVGRLTKDGARVAFTGRDAERANVTSESTGASFIAVDARDTGSVRSAVESAVAVLGGLDGLVIASGALHHGSLTTTTDEVWDDLLAINLKAAFATATSCLEPLRASNGSVVVVASAASVWPDLSSPAYAVTKRALVALVELLAAEAAPEVRVNAVSPGDSETPMRSLLDPDAQRPQPTPAPLGGLATPAAVAESVMFLLSDAAAFITGINLRVDGGLRGAHRP